MPDLSGVLSSESVQKLANQQSWQDPASFWTAATKALANYRGEPRTVLLLDAMLHNLQDLVRRSSKPIRLASKSIRSRAVINAVLKQPGFAGVLSYTLAEGLWLADDERTGVTDVVVAYPSADTANITKLSHSRRLASRVTLMVDSTEHLEIIKQAATGPEQVRVAIDMDMSYRSKLYGFIGVRRSKLHHPEDVIAFAKSIVLEPKLRLVGLMGYEAQVAGVGDNPSGQPIYAKLLQRIQRQSIQEFSQRRQAAVAGLRELVDLEFVNTGGTGSLESSSSDPSATETTAGSGVFGPHLFDHYTKFSPAPAAAFALPVLRKPQPDIVTMMGGGWIASGWAEPTRMPKPVWPEGLNYLKREGAGEVQTPLQGDDAKQLRVADLVWFRHTKSGEISEHSNEFVLIAGEAEYGTIPTYRGEGKVFL